MDAQAHKHCADLLASTSAVSGLWISCHMRCFWRCRVARRRFVTALCPGVRVAGWSRAVFGSLFGEYSACGWDGRPVDFMRAERTR
jgi:hypothetical protein